MNPITFKDEPSPESGPHHPRRNDAVAEWLIARREAFPRHSVSWWVIDRLLNEYREMADYGLALDEEGGDR